MGHIPHLKNKFIKNAAHFPIVRKTFVGLLLQNISLYFSLVFILHLYLYSILYCILYFINAFLFLDEFLDFVILSISVFSFYHWSGVYIKPLV